MTFLRCAQQLYWFFYVMMLVLVGLSLLNVMADSNPRIVGFFMVKFYLLLLRGLDGIFLFAFDLLQFNLLFVVLEWTLVPGILSVLTFPICIFLLLIGSLENRIKKLRKAVIQLTHMRDPKDPSETLNPPDLLNKCEVFSEYLLFVEDSCLPIVVSSQVGECAFNLSLIILGILVSGCLFVFVYNFLGEAH